MTASEVPPGIRTPGEWARLLVGLVLIYGVFELSARALGSDRGQWGPLVCAVVLGAAIAVERWLFRRDLREAAMDLGLGWPRGAGVAVALGVVVLLLLTAWALLSLAGAPPRWVPGSAALLPGLLAQGGIAEETLFRGYLFGTLRRGRGFWAAAGVSTLPFVAVHLSLFLTMPWPLASAAVALSAVLAIPLASLFERGGSTVWAPALAHFVIQAVPKVVTVPDGSATSFPLVWMGVTTAVLPLVLLLPPPRPDARKCVGHTSA